MLTRAFWWRLWGNLAWILTAAWTPGLMTLYDSQIAGFVQSRLRTRTDRQVGQPSSFSNSEMSTSVTV